MLYSLDRLEKNTAIFIAENKEIKTNIKNVCPKIKEGYLYNQVEEKFILNEEESKKLKAENFNRLQKLINKK